MNHIDLIVDQLGGKKILTDALVKNLNWLKKSFIVNDNLGSAESRSLFGAWKAAYPETTGYLIPTLINASVYFDNKSLLELASSQLNYFLKIRNSDGSFYKNEKDFKPLVFDSSQILLGLCSLNKHNKTSSTYDLIEFTYYWLLERLDEQGHFVRDNYKKKYNPSYYSRISWAMFLSEQEMSLNVHAKTKMLYHKIWAQKNENHSFRNWSFDGRELAFSHTIVYIYRGLWESALLLNDHASLKKIIESLHQINSVVGQNNGFFCGEYDQKWNGNNSFICAAGNAQLVVLLLKIYMHTKDPLFLKNIFHLLKPLLKAQSGIIGFNNGAISSSIPLWGKYQRFNYTNWTQKFFSDALLMLLQANASAI